MNNYPLAVTATDIDELYGKEPMLIDFKNKIYLLKEAELTAFMINGTTVVHQADYEELIERLVNDMDVEEQEELLRNEFGFRKANKNDWR